MKHFYCFITGYFDIERDHLFGMKLLKIKPFVIWYGWKDWRVDARKFIYGDD
jgi:hypothetical protein